MKQLFHQHARDKFHDIRNNNSNDKQQNWLEHRRNGVAFFDRGETNEKCYRARAIDWAHRAC